MIMASNLSENTGNSLGEGADPSLERDMLELKLRAELGMLDSYSSGELSPEMQQMFLQQVYDFEKNSAEGIQKTFAETLSIPAFEPWPESEITWTEGEKLVEQVCQGYRDQKVEVIFGFDYPPSVKYAFLTLELPELPNYYGKIPDMLTAVIYEEYVPNHGAIIEENATKFIKAFFERDVEIIKDVIWRDQISPENGPYDGLLLIQYFEKWFASLSGFEKYDFSILETSYEWLDGEETESESTQKPGNYPIGFGYAEGMVGYRAHSLVQTEPIQKVGHFKLYFEWRDGHWGIIYPQFPGLTIPPEG